MQDTIENSPGLLDGLAAGELGVVAPPRIVEHPRVGVDPLGGSVVLGRLHGRPGAAKRNRRAARLERQHHRLFRGQLNGQPIRLWFALVRDERWCARFAKRHDDLRERRRERLCGSSPVEISTGKTRRHRLNRAGDRQANAALWTIVMSRIASGHQPTADYMERRIADGLSKRDAIRCLKRYVARQVFNDIRTITLNQTHQQAA